MHACVLLVTSVVIVDEDIAKLIVITPIFVITCWGMAIGWAIELIQRAQAVLTEYTVTTNGISIPLHCQYNLKKEVRKRKDTTSSDKSDGCEYWVVRYIPTIISMYIIQNQNCKIFSNKILDDICYIILMY